MNAIWLIVTLVLFFAAMFFGYTANDEMVRAEEQAKQAQIEAKAATDKLQKLQAEHRQLSEIVGYYDPENLQAVSDVALAQADLDQFKAAIGSDADASVTTFQAAWPLAIRQISSRDQSLTTVTQQATERQSEVQAARSSAQTVATDKDQEISRLTKELADLRTKYTEEVNTLEGRIARLTQERGTSDEEAIAARKELADKLVEHSLVVSEYEARMNQLLKDTVPLREPNGIDGMVVGTSAELNMAYINRGAKDRIVRGMVFQVLDGDPTKRTVKGEVEVIDVQDSISEVAIRSLTDQYNAIAKGDVITNPMYDPEGERNAVLAGRFDGKYNRQEVALLLKQIGINVQDDLDRSTMFLIMGNPLYKDPETGETLEEPLKVTDLPIYGLAKSWGVQMISIDQLRHFFRM